MNTVLSIDVDAFVDPPVTLPESGTRPDEAHHTVARLSEIMAWAKGNLRIVRDVRTPGCVMDEHDEAFRAIRDALGQGLIRAPFRLFNIDAHADLGMGLDGGPLHIFRDVIRRPLEERAANLREGEFCGLSPANWIAYAMANRWIDELVHGAGTGRQLNDVPWFYRSGEELLQIPPIAMDGIDPINHRNRPPGQIVECDEPCVAFRRQRFDKVQLDEPPDLLLVCRSPAYLPPSGDPIFEALAEMVDESWRIGADRAG